MRCGASLLVQVHGAVCDKDGHKLFQDVTLKGHWTGWSGFRDTFDQHHAHQVAFMLLLVLKHAAAPVLPTWLI